MKCPSCGCELEVVVKAAVRDTLRGKWIAYEKQLPPLELECEFKRDESRMSWLGPKVVRGKRGDFNPAFNVSGLLWRPVEIKYDDDA